jgi:hypothetical protein
MLGYGLSDAFPSNAGHIWLIADSVGTALSIYIVLVHQRAAHGAGRLAGSVLTLAAFAIAIFYILPPHSGKLVSVLIPMIVAAAYALFGIWHGRRLFVTGFLIAACTMFGFFFLRSHFNFWMAIVGGSALILTSAWLKRV